MSRKTESFRGSSRSEWSHNAATGTRHFSTIAAEKRRAARQQHLRQKSDSASQQDQQATSKSGLKHARNSKARATEVRERRRNHRSHDAPAHKSSHTGSPPEVIETIPDISPKTRNYSPRERFQDQVRRNIASALVYSFMGTIVLSFALALYFSGNQAAWSNVKDLVQVLITAETGLMGAAIGFYFGSSTQRDRD